MSFLEHIQTIQELVLLCVNAHMQTRDATRSPLEAFEDVAFDADALISLLDSIGAPNAALAAVDASGTDEDLASALKKQSRDFCLATAFSLAAQRLLVLIPQTDTETARKRRYRTHELAKDALDAIEGVCVLFDFVARLALTLPPVRSYFFSVLQTVLETLLPKGTTHMEIFWYYMESRKEVIATTLFDANDTQDRIALLRICNGLTDQYYERNSAGKYDSYEKDSFHDAFQARVRAFVATLFNFDDATGLNKLLVLAGRTNRNPPFPAGKSSDSQLLSEIMSFQRLLRDPYTFLKSPRLLASQVEYMSRISTYLLDEEAKYARVHPVRDYFDVKATEQATALPLPDELVFVPEQYWLSGFEQTQSGERFDALLAEDKKFAVARFDDSKFRKLLLIQIFLVSCFFVELQASRKQTAVKNSTNLVNPKHIFDETTPDYIAVKIQKIKREIVRLIRTWNSPLLYVLQHLGHSEEYWWSWLMEGRQKGGSVLVVAPAVREKDAEETQQKFAAMAPYKTKRYFNSHVTPQLSRRMKVPAGLELLECGASMDVNRDAEIAALQKEIKAAEDAETRRDLVEQKHILVWKKMNALRESNWLELDSYVRVEDLTDALAEVDEAERTNEAVEGAEDQGAAETTKAEGSETVQQEGAPEEHPIAKQREEPVKVERTREETANDVSAKDKGTMPHALEEVLTAEKPDHPTDRAMDDAPTDVKTPAELLEQSARATVSPEPTVEDASASSLNELVPDLNASRPEPKGPSAISIAENGNVPESPAAMEPELAATAVSVQEQDLASPLPDKRRAPNEVQKDDHKRTRIVSPTVTPADS